MEIDRSMDVLFCSPTDSENTSQKILLVCLGPLFPLLSLSVSLEAHQDKAIEVSKQLPFGWCPMKKQRPNTYWNRRCNFTADT